MPRAPLTLGDVLQRLRDGKRTVPVPFAEQSDERVAYDWLLSYTQAKHGKLTENALLRVRGSVSLDTGVPLREVNRLTIVDFVARAKRLVESERPAHPDTATAPALAESSELVNHVKKKLATAPITDEAGGGKLPRSGMSWKKARDAAEAQVDQSGFPGSVTALAKIVGCNPHTMMKAIDNSPKLRQARMANEEDGSRKPRRNVQMNDVISAGLASKNESPDTCVATDELFARLCAQATPEERERLENMTSAKRRELVTVYENNPDNEFRFAKPKRR